MNQMERSVEVVNRAKFMTGERIIELKDNDVMEMDDWAEVIADGGCECCIHDETYQIDLFFTFGDGAREKVSFADYNAFSFGYTDFFLFIVHNLENFKEMTKQEFLECLTKENIYRDAH